ncbi:AAA family ATPase [Streptococcus suis]|uniref:AAA family ATPase n=1 Tax=Streptococcus suis TaxID=1307 RepID=UPI000CF64C32|nr:AAA family ATPase [Streptococcus suis]MDW8649617.1 AAA family ATPase [Streptococcus suis]
MYIKSMNISKLHGIYNYNIEFNEDITILYGENGSGKTTILAMLESILTAQIWQLFQYEFHSIIVESDTKYSISINKCIDNESGLYLKVEIKDNSKEENIRISDDKIFHNVITSLSTNDYSDRVLKTKLNKIYPIIAKLDELFNDLYLPVNRLSASTQDDRSPIKKHQRYETDIDNSLDFAIELISREHRIAESRKFRYNEEFKNEILSSTLGIINENPLEFLSSPDFVDFDKIDELQNKYLNMFNNLNMSNNSHQIGEFFKNYKEKLTAVLQHYISERMELKNTVENESQVDYMKFFIEVSEIIRMRKILPIAENLEKRLSDTSLKINIFVEIVNSFFEDSMERKEIILDNFGRPYFKIDGRSDKISLYQLSSGEKQIIILFANLVLTRNYTGKKIFKDIFISDEPEISLHMLWQMKLIPNILKSRKKLQIILATHSPEIVGEFEHRMFELKKERVANE